jgi:hypothetical protein
MIERPIVTTVKIALTTFLWGGALPPSAGASPSELLEGTEETGFAAEEELAAGAESSLSLQI